MPMAMPSSQPIEVPHQMGGYPQQYQEPTYHDPAIQYQAEAAAAYQAAAANAPKSTAVRGHKGLLQKQQSRTHGVSQEIDGSATISSCTQQLDDCAMQCKQE